MAVFNASGSYAILNTQQSTYYVQGGHYFTTGFVDLGTTAPNDYQSMSSERSDNVNISGGTINNVTLGGSVGGLGTMSTQNANAVAVTGGSIDGTPIGNTAQSTVKCTALTTSGAAGLQSVAVTQTITNYNGSATVGNGIPSEISQLNLVNQNANIASNTLYAVPSTGAGFYRASCYAVETTADGASSTLPSIGIGWTDSDSSVALLATTVTPTNPANAAGAFGAGSQVLYAKASTNITYQTSAYASGTAGAMKYSVHIKLEYLG